MAKKAQASVQYSGPPLPTLYSRPSDPAKHLQLDVPWVVMDSRGMVISRHPNFEEAETFIAQQHKSWRAAQAQGGV